MNTFDAFISYNQEADAALAEAIQHGLEKIVRRWYQLRSFRLYRDLSNQGAHPDLEGQVQQALASSGHLILLLSPEAARSDWVARKEVGWWLTNRGVDSIILVLTSGVLEWDKRAGRFSENSALPVALRDAIAKEPLWIDLTWARSDPKGLTLRHIKFRDALLTIAARLKGVSKDALDSDAARALRANRSWAAAALVALSLALGWSLVEGYRVNNARILSEARFLQSFAPAESLLVLEALNRRWMSAVALGDMTAELVAKPGLAVRRHVLPESSGSIAPLRDGYAFIAPSDVVEVWSKGKLKASIPPRPAPQGSGSKAFWVQRLHTLRPDSLAIIDSDSCVRLAGTCLNPLGAGFGPFAFDSAGNIAALRDDGVVLIGGDKEQLVPYPVAGVTEVALGREEVLLRDKDDNVTRLGLKEGKALGSAQEVKSIGSCADGSLWMLKEKGAFQRSPLGGEWRQLPGKAPWHVAPRCDMVVDGQGDVYAENGDPVAKAVAADWQYSGNPVKLAFSNKGRRLAVSSPRGPITIHDFESGEKLSLLGHTGRVFSLSFTHDDTQVLSASFDGTLRVFDVSSGLMKPSTPHPGAESVYGLGGGYAVSKDPYIVRRHYRDPLPNPPTVKVARNGTVEQVRIAEDWRVGDLFVVFDTDGRKLVLCTTFLCNGGREVRKLSGEVTMSGDSAWARASSDGRYIAAIEEDTELKVYDLNRTDNTPIFRYASPGLKDATFDLDGGALHVLDAERVISVQTRLPKIAEAIGRHIRFCLTAEERTTYLGEWAWLARNRAAACEKERGTTTR